MSPNRNSAAWSNRVRLNQRRVGHDTGTKNYLALLTDRTDVYSPLSSKPSLLASAEYYLANDVPSRKAAVKKPAVGGFLSAKHECRLL